MVQHPAGAARLPRVWRAWCAGTFVCWAVFGGISACDNTLDPLPLELTLGVSATTAAVGDTLNFLAQAQGGNLIGVEIDYGDNTGALYSTAGARTAHITFRHAYDASGVFQVRATVTDAASGAQKDAALQVTVP